MPKLKHINADVLTDEELSAVSDKFREAERRMNEKLLEEIEENRTGMKKSDGGVWIPKVPLQ